jgi:hypothetical protein
VSHHISLTGEAHTTAETLIKLCAAEIATCALSEQSKKKLATAHLSNNIVAFKICQQI